MEDYGSSDPSILPLIISAVVALFLFVAIYVFLTICAKKICQKCGKEPGGIIWVPIIGWLPVMECAGMQTWMIVLYIVFQPAWVILLALGLAKARNKPPVLAVLMALFCAPAFWGWMAFSE